jgi:hypothetical protein
LLPRAGREELTSHLLKQAAHDEAGRQDQAVKQRTVLG